MTSTRKQKKPVVAEAIARRADQGKDVSQFFTNKGRMMGAIQRVNVDFASPMLEELDNAAKEMNISRQAVIKNVDPPGTRPSLPGGTPGECETGLTIPFNS